MNTSLTNKTLSAATVAIVCITLTLAGTARAAFVASDLNNGGANTGFSDQWDTSTSSNVFTEEAPEATDLTYANYDITQTGSPEKIMTSDGNAGRQAVRTLNAPMSGEVWFTFLAKVPTDTEYASLSFNYGAKDYDPEKADASIRMRETQSEVGLNAEGTTVTGTGSFSAGTTHLLLGQMNVVSGDGDDTLNVWVDPDLTGSLTSADDLPSANVTSTDVDFADSITDIGAGGSQGRDTGAVDVYTDAYRLSDTSTAFEDVTGVAVPEPSTAILLMLGLIGVFRRRRPRK